MVSRMGSFNSGLQDRNCEQESSTPVLGVLQPHVIHSGA